MSKIFDGFKIGFGIFLFFSLIFGIVYAVGFHSADEIVSGTFQGDYIFNGNLDFTNSSMNGIGNYSTSEIKTGSFWIDGKPIYRKVIVGTLNNGNIDIPHGISNFDHLTKYEGYFHSGSSHWSTQSSYKDGYESDIRIDATNIKTSAIGLGTVYNAYYILEYTKTTD